MKNNPYENFTKEELILRDHLAIDRTRLANESTFLAYIRTALAVMAAGATVVHFLNGVYLDIVGFVLIGLGVLILALGFIRYQKMETSIKNIRKI